MKGRKRHLLVATPGLVLTVLVPAADIPDRDGGRRRLAALQAPQPVAEPFPRRQPRWVDAGERGGCVDWGRSTRDWSVAVVQHGWTGVAKGWVLPGQEPPEQPPGFQRLKWRWLVERTFAWIGCSRRMSTEYA